MPHTLLMHSGLAKIKMGSAVDMTRPNYVQVTDTRGTWDGWTLTVAESDQFQNTSGEKLTGAELSFSKGYTDGTTAAKPGYINNTNFVVSTAAKQNFRSRSKSRDGNLGIWSRS